MQELNVEQPVFTQTRIDAYVTRYLEDLPDLSGKTVLDIPCGDGRASYVFMKKNATVLAYDLFPQFSKVPGLTVQYADMNESLPLDDESVDIVICQEGIEHIPNHLALLREFNRVLKPGGRLILTTPNLSHLRARVSMLFTGAEYWKGMPPTEIDSIWFSDKDSDKLYIGHLFQLGVHQLQTLISLSGFEVRDRLRTKPSVSSIILGILLYPCVFPMTLLGYACYRHKHKHVPLEIRDQVYRRHVKLNLCPKTLFCKHIFWVMEKVKTVEETVHSLHEMR
jgi:SAM-dependent methyltransferase